VSEVKRVFLPGFTELPGCGERCWSSAIDVDQWGARIQAYGMTSAEASGLRDEILTALIGFNTAQLELAALREELAEMTDNFNIAVRQKLELSKRLTAAEQRNEELTGLIEEFCQRVECGEVRSKQTYAKFKAALKPTESGASE
jgi:regulator of replication initiation timing